MKEVKTDMARCSVVVPVYNVEKYINRCIDSILSQTYRDYELILVDDGSTDSSGRICDLYATKDSRIHSIHKKNGGVSSARNTGIDYSTAEYITFIDSDDYVEKDYLQSMMKNIEDSDCVISGIRFVGAVKRVDTRKLMNCYICKDSINWHFMELDRNYVFYAIYAKIYKKKIIENYNIKFSEEYSILEDSAFVMEYLGYSEKWCVIEYVGYNYRQMEEMSLRKRFHKEAMEALEYRYKKSENILKYLNKENLEYYYQVQYTWFDIYLTELIQTKQLDIKEKKTRISKYIENEVIINFIRNAPYEDIKHIKYNMKLFIYKTLLGNRL